MTLTIFDANCAQSLYAARLFLENGLMFILHGVL